MRLKEKQTHTHTHTRTNTILKNIRIMVMKCQDIDIYDK